MKALRIIPPFVLVFLCVFCAPKKINQLKKGLREGLWITYADSARTHLISKGHYKSGDMIGKWRFFGANNKIQRIEKYKGDDIRIRFYDENEKLSSKGQAKLVSDEKKIHFYYYDKWYYYLPGGELEKILYYKNGISVKEEYKIKNKVPKYDSLAKVLKQMENDYDTHNYHLRIAKSNSTKAPEQYRLRRLEKQKNDSLLFAQADRILLKFGYPSKKNVGERNYIIFYIVGYADWKIKEKYLETFRQASLMGDISPRDFAYFEDKLFVAKSGYQVYGTQFIQQMKDSVIYYPILDLQNLNERRKISGLEAVDLKYYREKN